MGNYKNFPHFKNCVICGTEYFCGSVKKYTEGKYCGRICQIKGMAEVNRQREYTPHSIETKQKISMANTGKYPSYGGTHNWVKRQIGKATMCVKCGSKENVGWANISQTYKKDVEDYMSLCRKCHTVFDMQHREERRAYKWA